MPLIIFSLFSLFFFFLGDLPLVERFSDKGVLERAELNTWVRLLERGETREDLSLVNAAKETFFLKVFENGTNVFVIASLEASKVVEGAILGFTVLSCNGLEPGGASFPLNMAVLKFGGSSFGA